jgi:hypothetical protein
MANQKKISELPIINALSGSAVSVFPVVVGSTTNQISAENVTEFSRNIIIATANTFTQPQTINGNVTISGRLTVNEVVAQYETASILFSTGSTKLGDELTDKHEITGSLSITGSLQIPTSTAAPIGSTAGQIYYNTTDTNIYRYNGTSWLVAAGTSGTSGTGGTSGTDGTAGSGGTSGTDGTAGSGGTSGTDGTAGSGGTSGTDGTAGSGGTSGTDGTAGSGGTSGTGGTAGSGGTSGTDGTAGSGGTSGTDGSAGSGGTSGTGGTNGTAGSGGTSGTSGDIQLFNAFTGSVNIFTGSIRSEVGLIEAYTASLKGAAIVSSSQQITNYYKFAETASANTFYGNQTISGSLNVSGSTAFIGVHTLSGSNTIVGNTLMTGTNTIIGNTEMSGSIDVSGSSNFHNSIFIVTGSQFYTGSSDFKGNQTITGSLNVTGNINVDSGSGFFYEGNKLFNRGQFYHTATLSGSANTAYPFQYNTTDTSVTNGTVYVDNNSRIYVSHTGIYNVQFSAQLHTTANEACDFSVWFAMTGSNIMDSNTDYSIEKVSGGGYAVAALNYLAHIQSGSYIELYYSKTTANGQIQAKGTQSTPTRPATPSVILTVTQIA